MKKTLALILAYLMANVLVAQTTILSNTTVLPKTTVLAGGVLSPASYVSGSYAGTAGGTCASTCTQALGVNATSGGIIIVTAKWQGSTTTLSSLSGTNGTCSLLAATVWTDATNNDAGESGYCLPTSSVAYTVSALMSTGTFQFAMQVSEYTGQAASTPIDVSLGASVTCAGTSCACPTVTTTVNNDVVVCGGHEYSGNGANFASGSGTLRGSVAGQMGLQDQTVVTAASTTPSIGSNSGLGVTGLSTIAIKP